MFQFAVFCPCSLLKDLVSTLIAHKAPQDDLFTWNNAFYIIIYNLQKVIFLTKQKWYPIRINNYPLTTLVLLLNGSEYLNYALKRIGVLKYWVFHNYFHRGKMMLWDSTVVVVTRSSTGNIRLNLFSNFFFTHTFVNVIFPFVTGFIFRNRMFCFFQIFREEELSFCVHNIFRSITGSNL